MLPGAAEGISYFITPNMSRLGDPQVTCHVVKNYIHSIIILKKKYLSRL